MDNSSLVPTRKLELVVEGSDGHTPTWGCDGDLSLLCAQCHRPSRASRAVHHGAARRAKRWRATQQGGVLSTQPRCPLWPRALSDTPPDSHSDLITATLREAQSRVPGWGPCPVRSPRKEPVRLLCTGAAATRTAFRGTCVHTWRKRK